jgi:energy-coupling factor transport system permease protein
MIRAIPLGTYYPGKSLLHRLQARTKLFLLIWIVLWLTIANHRMWHFWPYAVALVLLTLGLIFSGISLSVLWQRIWLLVLLTALGIWPILTASDGTHKNLFTFGAVPIPYGPLRLALLITGCLSALLILSMCLPWSLLRDCWLHPWLRRTKGIILLLALISFLLLWLASGPPANYYFLFGPTSITDNGVWALITFSSFLLLLYVFSLFLTMTTSPMALIEGVSMILAPLRRFQLPVDSFALMALLALRFIPTLLEKIEQLSKAQTARGADIMSGTFRERLQSLAMLFVPLIHSVMREASELGIALEARGYQSEGRQTPLYETAFHWRDALVCLLVLGLTVASLFF